MALVKIENLKKSFGKNTVLDGVSFEIEKGDVKVIIGPSGTGKSTLLRCINMINPPDEGRIYIEDEEITAKKADVHKIRQKVGMVLMFLI